VELILKQPDLFPTQGKAQNQQDLTPEGSLAAFFEFRRSKLVPGAASTAAEVQRLTQLEEAAHEVVTGCMQGHEGRVEEGEVADVKLESVEIEGFRCFRDKVKLSYEDSGVSVITGRNKADEGATLAPFC
jgi:hypothetical protein